MGYLNRTSGRFEPLEQEIARARAKFPENAHLTAALAEEVGELAQAYLQGRLGDARAEALQVACVAMRIVEEGDAEFEWKARWKNAAVAVNEDQQCPIHPEEADGECWPCHVAGVLAGGGEREAVGS